MMRVRVVLSSSHFHYRWVRSYRIGWAGLICNHVTIVIGSPTHSLLTTPEKGKKKQPRGGKRTSQRRKRVISG